MENDILNKHDLISTVQDQITSIINHEQDIEFYRFNQKWISNEKSLSRIKSFYSISSEIDLLFTSLRRLNHLNSQIFYQIPLIDLNTISECAQKVLETLFEIKAFWEDEVEKSKVKLKTNQMLLSAALLKSSRDLISAVDVLYVRKKLDDLKSETEALVVQKVENALISQAINTFEDKFYAPIARNHEEAATIWMFIGLFSLMLSAYIAYGLYEDANIIFMNQLKEKPLQDVPPFLFAGVLISKFFCLSLLVYANIWTLKNYKINKHNELKNKHRSTTLETFNYLLEGAGNDQESRRNILKLVSHTLFETKEFGYIENK